MEISNQVIELIRKEIKSKCSGMDTLTSDVEVINKNVSYFVEFTFKDTFVVTDQEQTNRNSRHRKQR